MPKQDYIKLFNALLADNYAAVEAQVRAPNFEFNQFLKFTDLHQLSGYLYLHIRASSLNSLFPLEYLEHLGERHTQQRQRCNDILQEATLIYDTFKAAHLSVLFLKGPFIAQQFYRGIDQRTYMDIDILVPMDDLLATEKLLRDIGFSRRSLVFVSNDAMTRFTHAYEYRKCIEEPAWSWYRKGLPLDLHWGLQCHFSFNLVYENIWKNREECSLEGRPFPVLNMEYSLVLNLLGIFIDIQLGTLRLKNFLDLYKILETVDPGMDWDVFAQKRDQENILIISLNVIDLVLGVLDCRDRFPGAASLIEKKRGLIRLKDPQDMYRLLERSRFAMWNRRWAYPLYQAPVILSVLWTLVATPFRVAAHESRDMRIVKRLRNRREGC